MTGGGKNQAQALDDIEQKVKDMIQLSVEGLPSVFDCDADFGDNNDIIGNIIYNYLLFKNNILLDINYGKTNNKLKQFSEV